MGSKFLGRLATLFFIIFICAFASSLEIANCFEHYRFGSVQAEIDTQTHNVTGGQKILFNGKVKNENNYPIVDGSIYVKIFRKQHDQKSILNGNILVDQFFALEDIHVDANTSKDISFEWNVPLYALSGDYQLATFFLLERKFNMLGLPFTEDIVGNTLDFKVESILEAGVEFEKNAVKINGEDYLFAAPLSLVDAGKEIKIDAPITNKTEFKQDVTVTFKHYSWSQLEEENIIEEKTQSVTLESKQTKIISHTVKKTDEPVEMIVAQAQYKDTKSILDIRIWKSAAQKARLNFASLDRYPLKSGELVTVFVCAHGISDKPVIENGRIEIEISDEAGNKIYSSPFDGRITGTMMGTSGTFTPQKDYENFTLKATLRLDGKVIDMAELEYDCQKINPEICKKASSPQDEIPAVQDGSDDVSRFFGIGIAAIALFVLIYFMSRGKKSRYAAMIAIAICAGLVMNSENASAASSVLWNKQLGNVYEWKSDHWNMFAYEPNISISSRMRVDGTYLDPYGTVQYYNDLSNGTSIPVGTNLYVTRYKYQFYNEEISWVATGYAMSTPYGKWSANAAPPLSTTCNPAYPNPPGYYCSSSCNINLTFPNLTTDEAYCNSVALPGGACDTPGWLRQHMYVSVNPDELVSVVNTGTANVTCSAVKNIFMAFYGYTTSVADCKVNSAGTINLQAVMSSTYGKIYTVNQDFFSVCRSNGVPVTETPGAVPASPYPNSFVVPERTLNLGLNAFVPNYPPSKPTVSGPASGLWDTLHSFTFSGSTDPDGDTIRYGVSWITGGSINEWFPSSGYIASGQSQVATHAWPSPGYNLKQTMLVVAEDNRGNKSVGTFYPIDLHGPLSANAGPDLYKRPLDWFATAGTSTGGVPPITYKWDYLAPNTASCQEGSTSAVLVDVCLSPGTSTARLTARDKYGTTATDNALIIVAGCSLSASPTSVEKNNNVTITVPYSGLLVSPNAVNPPGKVYCTSSAGAVNLTCTASPSAPYSGTCTGICTYDTDGRYTPRAEIYSQTQTLSWCSGSSINVNTIVPEVVPPLNVDAGPDADVNVFVTHLQNATVTGGKTPIYHQWSFVSNTADCSFTSSQTQQDATIYCTKAGTAVVKLSAYDSNFTVQTDDDTATINVLGTVDTCTPFGGTCMIAASCTGTTSGIYSCENAGDICCMPPVCGNSIPEAAEVCGEPGLAACSAGFSCTSCSCVAIPPSCGNGIADPGETCGEPSLPACISGYTCSSCACTLNPAVCGNGIADPGETCGELSLPACSAGFSCSSCGCIANPPLCGNGVAESGETCGEPGIACGPGNSCVGCSCVPTLPSCGNNLAESEEVCGEPGLAACASGNTCLACKCIPTNDITISISSDKNEYIKNSDNFITLKSNLIRLGGNFVSATAFITQSEEGGLAKTIYTTSGAISFASGTGFDSKPVPVPINTVSIAGLAPGTYTFTAITPLQVGEISSANNTTRVSVTVRSSQQSAVAEIPPVFAAIVAILAVFIVARSTKRKQK